MPRKLIQTACPYKIPFKGWGNVDKAIEGVYNTIKTIKPQVVFSVSPAPNKEGNFNNLYADIAKWTQSGWVDILIPQLYQEIGNSYNPFVAALNEDHVESKPSNTVEKK